MKKVPMLNLNLQYEYMNKDIDSAVKKCLDHQKWICGPEVKDLEDAVSEYIGVKHCIGVSSGTDALVLSLRALAIKLKGQEYFDRGDEIITTSFTFTATGDAILRAGATPVFVDIHSHSYNIDTSKMREYLTNADISRVVGILPVHLYGQACEMDEIMEIALDYNLFVVEDAAQAFGGVWKDKKLGSIGTAGAFSFFPSKNLGGFGDGGMVSTNDNEIAELVRMLLRHGSKNKHNAEHIGYNARLDTLQAAILLAKIKYIDDLNERRRHVAKLYTNELSGIDSLFLPTNKSSIEHFNLSTYQLPDGHVYHQYTVRTPGRKDLQTYLWEKGISTAIYYPCPLHRMKMFRGRMKVSGRLTNSENASEQVLSLPIEPLQKHEENLYVAEHIKQFFRV
jgi:dTDP-4-amino-4,6-dideoxygalactose transaminase